MTRGSERKGERKREKRQTDDYTWHAYTRKATGLQPHRQANQQDRATTKTTSLRRAANENYRAAGQTHSGTEQTIRRSIVCGWLCANLSAKGPCAIVTDPH